MTALQPFYLPLDAARHAGPGAVERFEATFSSTGPWFADAQHGGPPSALLVRALERVEPGRADAPPSMLARITVEVLGVVPAGPVEVRAGVERSGRTIEMLYATMSAGGRDVLRARAWRLARGDTTAHRSGLAPSLPGPEHATVRTDRPQGWLPGFMDAVEWAWLDGWLAEPGPGRAWIRPRVPIVEGERASPLQNLMIGADSANGLAAPLDVREWLFVNTELTVHLHRDPVAGWAGVDAATVVGPTGVGTVSATLFDADGHLGRVAQALTIRRR